MSMDSSDMISRLSTLNHLALNPTYVNKDELDEAQNVVRNLLKVYGGLQKLGQAEDLRSSGLRWLRNLKSLLLCLRKLVVDEPPNLSPLLSRIEDAIARIPEDGFSFPSSGIQEVAATASTSTHVSTPGVKCSHGVSLVVQPHASSFQSFRRIEEAVADIPNVPTWSEIHSLGKEVDLCFSFSTFLPYELINVHVDDVCRNLNSVLEIALDFVHLARKSMNPFIEFKPVEVEVIDGFKVQITVLKSFLLFAMRAGVEPDQLRDLFLCIQPLAIIAARVFIADGIDDKDSFEVAQSKCLEVNQNCHKLYHAFSQALKTSKLSFRQTPVDNVDGDTLDIFKKFNDSLIALLWDVLRVCADPSELIKALYERLRFFRSFMNHMAESSDEKMWDQIEVMICGAGVFVLSLCLVDAETKDLMLSELLGRFNAFQTAFKSVVSQTSESSSSKANELDSDAHEMEEVQNEAAILSLQPSQSTPHAVDFQDDEVNPVLDRLIRGSKQLRIVPISGMAGIGKTTFALKLYNHPSVNHYFHSRVWCTISQVMDKKKVLCSLLNQSQSGNHSIFNHSRSENHSEMTEDDLANKLRQSLKRKRYLILLDDVWTPEVMDSLRASFPDDSTCSRIILTSRYRDITPGLHDQQPHLLRLRKDNECVEILGMKLSDKEGWNPELGMQIAKLCKGLPMTVVIVAGLLVATRKQDWNGILDSLSSGSVSRSEQCKSALELSYKHMPDYLKPCFLYFGAFPEDEEVSVRKMSTLWIAEGFVRGNKPKTGQDVARKYLEELIDRSLVTVAKNRSIGGVRTFRIHDLLHDFCRAKSKEENLFHLLLQRHEQLSDFNEPRNLLRLSIHSDPNYLKKSRLFCPRAHSMLLFSGEQCHDHRLFDTIFIVQIFKLLKVLHMDDIRLANGIPGEIELLTRLTYLSVHSDKAVIPASVGKLSNLETFIADLKSDKAVTFPCTLWDLQELKYLQIDSKGYGFSLPATNLESCPSLSKLETICGVVFYSDGSMEKQMRKFPNIRRLKCSILPSVESLEGSNLIAIPGFLCHLESLTMCGRRGKLQCEFGSVQNLRKMTLKDFELSKEDIAVIGKFPNLEVLKFEHISFEGGELEMEEGEFSNLRFFKLDDWGYLKRWTASDDQLPCLRKLVLSWCRSLKEIPSYSLENSTTLEEIEVYNCSSAVEASVKDIERSQSDFGFSVKVYMIQSPQLEVRSMQRQKY